ncbi:MAG: MoxR family ATPase [Candidatus Sericytochromatia bacterium]|uniref:MoxR family ATPase n=1 Tax=Candidatus Tanganyikabacteria bacterium TaxID=2961651 RepID=A0A937X6L1_9BACT|nr:MoxR family ATPase [Candidatus Tanganyikabacteria bacterium]
MQVVSPQAIVDNIRLAIVGNEQPLRLVVSSLLAGGHILLEDVPGVGKTLVAKTLAQSIHGTFKRVQFSPDLMPSDVTGINMFQQTEGHFRFVPGPIFTNVLLADEINRASPRTQSSLLEAMEEGYVTVDGEGHSVPRPFLVIATQNPIEFHGTFPLPEAQLDRFAVSITLGYPDPEQEARLLAGHWARLDMPPVLPVIDLAKLSSWQEEVRVIAVDPALQNYVIRVLSASRSHPRITLGISPRGGLIWQRLAQAHAYLAGRKYVVPEDFKETAPSCLNHRLVLTGKSSRALRAELLRDLLDSVSVPV